MKHACATFTGFGRRCSASTLTSKNLQSAQWKVKVVGPCVRSDKDSRDGRDTGPHSSHNNVTEWRNESMEKTHNPYYKGFGISFYDTCDWQTIMYSLIPSISPQPDFCRLNLCSNNGISRSKHSLPSLHYMKSYTDELAHPLTSTRGTIPVYLNTLEWNNSWKIICLNLSCSCFPWLKMLSFFF